MGLPAFEQTAGWVWARAMWVYSYQAGCGTDHFLASPSDLLQAPPPAGKAGLISFSGDEHSLARPRPCPPPQLATSLLFNNDREVAAAIQDVVAMLRVPRNSLGICCAPRCVERVVMAASVRGYFLLPGGSSQYIYSRVCLGCTPSPAAFAHCCTATASIPHFTYAGGLYQGGCRSRRGRPATGWTVSPPAPLQGAAFLEM